jgi:hypothetical protein
MVKSCGYPVSLSVSSNTSLSMENLLLLGKIEGRPGAKNFLDEMGSYTESASSSLLSS